MKCPHCQTINSESAVFCIGCGQKLEQPIPVAPVKMKSYFCTECGTAYDEGSIFCTSCGHKLVDSPVSEPTPAPVPAPEPAPVPVPAPEPIPTPVPEPIPTPQPVLDSQPVLDPIQSVAENPKKKFPIILIIIPILGIICGVVFALGLKGIIPIHGLSPIESDTAVESDTTEETETAESSSISDEDLKALLVPYDDMVEQGKSELIALDYEAGLGHLSEALTGYSETAKKYNKVEDISAKMESAFIAYGDGTLAHITLLESQPESAPLYQQIRYELDNALAHLDELTAQGFEIDGTAITENSDTLLSRYRGYFINDFNEFTERESWSRTEAIDLMNGAHDAGLFSDDDLDDPVRLRYVYALAWSIQKQNETDLASGSITPADAAQRIRDVLAETDYNPMLLFMCADFMDQAGEDSSAYHNAYDTIVTHLQETQGLSLGTDVDLAHFWYFNDFGETSVDATNGVTPENRQWIRDTISSML
ncbi:MAG: zinc ribbon domain-containing protein [Lachnospiraceae bacterium]|nr:zinc ribbon domain-containing protein [Lachnospiraceae bacterium]